MVRGQHDSGCEGGVRGCADGGVKGDVEGAHGFVNEAADTFGRFGTVEETGLVRGGVGE